MIKSLLKDVKIFLDAYPKLIEALEIDDYQEFNSYLTSLLSVLPRDSGILDKITLCLYEYDLLNDIIQELKYIPEWCRFKLFTSYIVPEGVETIPTRCFYYCTQLKSLELPQSLKVICSQAFSRCVDLTTINIPEGVTNVESYAFSDCIKLKEITIPSSVKFVEGGAFSECVSLEKVNWLDSSVKSSESIGYGVFDGCDVLVRTNSVPVRNYCSYNDIGTEWLG